MNSPRIPRLFLSAIAVTALVVAGTSGFAQTSQDPGSNGANQGEILDLQDQVRQLRTLVEQMRAENAQSRAEMHQLRQDLEVTRALLEHSSEAARNEVASANTPNATTPAPPATAEQNSLEDRVQKLEDTTSLIGEKVNEQYQTKVETASKYRARLHGIVLMNAFGNSGKSNDLDFPDYSRPVLPGNPRSTVGATLRQSEIGLELFGPTVAGARTSADIQLDFSGGFPDTGNGVNFGFARLQTASLRFDWEHTSVVGGQDALFISPLSPTSFASLATPTFAFAGNLWAWTPQLRVEHRFAISDQHTVTVQAGIFDNLNWEFPPNSFYRTPQSGELSGQPAYGLRTSWSRSTGVRPMAIGVAGYFGRQNWLWDRYVDAWAGMADWQIPILPRFSWSGEFYRGRGIGGLGGGIGASILFGGDPTAPDTPIRGLNDIGGWTQLKFQLTPKLEFNGVIAEDNAFADDVRGFATDQNNFGSILGRNRGALANVIFRPRSDLVLAAEARRLRTFPIYTGSSSTNQVNLAVGILF